MLPWMAATLDGIVSDTDAVFEAKFMLPWSFSEEGAAEKYMAQLQHNMWVVGSQDGCSLRDHRRWQVGRDQDPRRSGLPTPPDHGGEEVLAVRPDRRDPSAVRGRGAPAPD